MQAKIPFSDPYWYFEECKINPFYKDTHRHFRDKIRAFCEKEIVPFTTEWEEKGDYPADLPRKAYEAGVYGALYPVELGGTPPDDFDYFHRLIYWDELNRCGSAGVFLSCFLTLSIALPPILHSASSYIKEKVARDCITARKVIALAVTEPSAGSDVANIETTAKREGDFYIINGSKKFITSGMKADFFTVAVRTGGEGLTGISLLLVERQTPGFTQRRMKTQGMWCSNTAYLFFDDCKVPAKNLIGKENQGFKLIMFNFNHERFAGAVAAIRGCRVCLEDAISYAQQRKTFGKRLIDHQVIRHKIADMARMTEATHALAEQVCFQLNNHADEIVTGRNIALLKVQATRTLDFCAREGSQILGGNSQLREGKGERIERTYREVRTSAIGGGSEEIMLDLAMRMSKL